MLNHNLIFQVGKMIGLDDLYLRQLNKDYQKADADERYRIMDILWDGFLKLLRRLTSIKYKQYLAEVTSGKRSLDNNLYQQAHQEVREYFWKILIGEIKDNEKIEELRQKIFSFTNTNPE